MLRRNWRSFPRKATAESVTPFAINPRPPGCLKLTGREGWRFRLGDYRAVYEFDDKERTVAVLHVGHRRDVYR